MDMKQILQAFDKTTSASVSAPESNDMKRFMSIVTEGANPHKVSLPVQMAMQHYTTPAASTPASPSLFKKYMAEAEADQQQKQTNDKQLLRQYARYIAEKVQVKESAIPGHSPGFTGGVGPGLQSNNPSESQENPQDVVTMDIPLLIRLLEYAREDAQTDMDLHDVTERLIQLSTSGDTLTMHEYDQIVVTPHTEEH
jgi:hypothetical protein